MTGTKATRSRLSSSFNYGVAASGLGLGAASLLAFLLTAQHPPLVYLAACPLLIMVMAWFPMLIGRTSGGIEIGFESCVLIFLALSVDLVAAQAIWSVGIVLTQLTADKRAWIKFFNTGLGMLASALALVVIDASRGAVQNPELFHTFAAAMLGAAVYFLVDFALSAVAVSLDERSDLWAELASPGTITALAVFLAIDTVGYRATEIVKNEPWWSAALLSVPLATIMVAARARSRGAEHARRLDVMLRTAVRVQALGDRGEVLDTLRDSSQALLRDSRVALRSEPPEAGEVGASVRDGADIVWVIGPSRNRARSTAADDQQALDALVAVVDEALARLALSEKMAYQAQHDALTGLANRTMFLDRVNHALTRQRRHGGKLAVLFCDLDSFKRINDSHGHAAGDELLIEVARRIGSGLREEDTLARLSGDEFAVLMESVVDLDDVEGVCRRLQSVLRTPIEVAGQEVLVTVTIGVAMSSGDDSAEVLLGNADMAMYHAKSCGKDRFEIYEITLGDERLRRLELVDALRQAVDNRELKVYYQPIVDMVTGEVRGLEALARWRWDDTWVSPEIFIPVAEDTGMIVKLGDLILGLVCADAPKLRAAAGRDISISVNVSARQLELDSFAERVLDVRADMEGVRLILEVTEHAFVSDNPRTFASMTALAAEGIRFAVDDFGIGFSSIGYLRRLPVHILKIDKSFVNGLDEDATACSLVRSMVTMARGLGLDVVVEGVERVGQVEHLTRHCDAVFGQGFLFARPQPCEETLEALTRPPSYRALVTPAGSGAPQSLGAAS